MINNFNDWIWLGEHWEPCYYKTKGSRVYVPKGIRLEVGDPYFIHYQGTKLIGLRCSLDMDPQTYSFSTLKDPYVDISSFFPISIPQKSICYQVSLQGSNLELWYPEGDNNKEQYTHGMSANNSTITFLGLKLYLDNCCHCYAHTIEINFKALRIGTIYEELL